MFLKRENELDFACQSCGNCCRNFSINITHLDIQRILENRPDLKTEDFISFSASTEKNDPESFVATYGKRQMTLKTKPNSKECVFLKNNICSIHAFKPRVCKVWPFSLEKGQEISWIKEHRSFIKKKCQHTSIPGLNDPEELKQLIKQHYKERKIFSKIVEKWNNEKKQEIKEDEIFSDILDEHFLEYILKELDIKHPEIITEEIKEIRVDFQKTVVEKLKQSNDISLITTTQYSDLFSENKSPDLSLNIFLKDNIFFEFFNEKNINKLNESINSEKYIVDQHKRTCSFLINDADNLKTLILYVHPLNDDETMPYDTRILHNPLDLKIKIQKFYDQTRNELEELNKKFWFRIKQAVNYIEFKNYLAAKIQLNSIFSEEFYSLIYWLNQEMPDPEKVDILDYKTDDLKDFMMNFGNYNNPKGQLEHLYNFIDIFQRVWKLTGLNADTDFENKIKSQILFLEKQS